MQNLDRIASFESAEKIQIERESGSNKLWVGGVFINYGLSMDEGGGTHTQLLIVFGFQK